MNFSEALTAMKMGNRIAREAWRGKIAYWFAAKGRIRQAAPDGTITRLRVIRTQEILADDWWVVT
jgi:hypothetical protein